MKTATPSNSAATGLFHGWKVLAALFISGFFVYGGGLYCFTLFVTPLTREFGWTREQTGGIVSFFWLTAPLLIVGGFATKRFGVTRLLLCGIVIEALCVLMLSTVSTLWQMYLLRAAMGFGKVMWAVSIPIVISHWFKRRFAFALGVAWAGWHVGGMVLSPICSWIIQVAGWRTACVALGVALLTIALLPIAWAQRIRSPAELALGLDGDPLGGPADVSPAPSSTSGPSQTDTLGTLLRSPTYWLVAVATFCFYSTYGGLLAHASAIVEGAGYTAGIASIVLGSTAGFAAFGGLVTGWILDRSPLMRVAVLVNGLLLVGAIGLMAVNLSPSLPMLVLYASCFGFTIGGSDIFFVALLRRRFPNVSVDFVYSSWYCMELGTLLVAPILAGWVYDRTGDYRQTLALLVGSATVAMVLSIFAARMRKA
jgi:MFS family permease